MPVAPGSATGAGSQTTEDRILVAALDVISECGVHGTTHRRIAAQASVHLGSTTRYFSGLSDILERAFAILGARRHDDYRRAFARAETPAMARESVVSLICGPLRAQPSELRALAEMWSYSNFNEQVRAVRDESMRACRAVLEEHFTKSAAGALVALTESWTMHRLSDLEVEPGLVVTIVDALAGRCDPPGHEPRALRATAGLNGAGPHHQFDPGIDHDD
ncbi:TetR/AcrR family transcriptional regulator [Microbacterium trichothecenolyticum]|uniref:TetR/AcrR family transcriptional regulator n=1 Tax=Microbacterium trichothecenolyticum TaxID=69370 RepID=UPI0006976B4F|nr:TetR family transcriptional regulator [Microbacterium trichothecenolyticum]